MLTITQLPDGRLSIKSDYFYRRRIKELPTATFDPNTKEWTIASCVLGTLEAKFAGELVFKTPRWVILNQPMPDMSKMYQISDKSIQVPKLKLKPYDYQDFGIRFMIDKLNKYNFVILADDVGLGKTLQSIGAIKWYMENKGVKKILIVCKKSIKKQWKDELRKFTDLLSMPNFFATYTGSTPTQRKKAYKRFQDADSGVLITNYHTFLNDTPAIQTMQIDFVVIDEVHSVKARTGKLNNNIGTVVKGKPTIFLTGTPVMSKPEDIFGIVQMSNPSYFGPYNKFRERYIVTDVDFQYGLRIVGAKNLDELRSKVQDIVIRRTEYEVSVQLPSVILQKKECDMDSTQENIICKIQKKQDEIGDSLQKLNEEESRPHSDKIKIREKIATIEASAKGLIAARQAAATDPRLFLTSNSKMMRETYGVMLPASYKMSNKTMAILETVEDIVTNGDKVILFTKFRTCAQMIANDIQKNLKEQTLLYTGAENEDQRDAAIDLFRNTVNYNILIGTEAMAEGLNLQVAKYVINIDQPDTLAIKTQRIGRARRVGSQFNNVIVYDMITMSTNKARSKDEERLENIQNNQNLTDALVNIDESQRQALIQAMKG